MLPLLPRNRLNLVIAATLLFIPALVWLPFPLDGILAVFFMWRWIFHDQQILDWINAGRAEHDDEAGGENEGDDDFGGGRSA